MAVLWGGGMADAEGSCVLFKGIETSPKMFWQEIG